MQPYLPYCDLQPLSRVNFQVVFFENNFGEFGTLNAVCEEIIKLYIFIESRQDYFIKGAQL